MRELFIRKLIKMVEQSDIDSLEVSSWGRSVRIIKNQAGGNGSSVAHAPAPPAPSAAQLRTEPSMAARPGATTPEAKPVTHKITAPMVGTFYLKPAPEARPFVEVGAAVKAGQVVCIVEAMKLMNEIQSDIDGTISAILIEDGQPVEYGQPLFEVT